jgi:putative ABC transport system permease protein
MKGILQDARYAVRLLVKSPVYTLAATMSLALGIGANTTIFSLVNGLFLHPLPVAEPARLAAVFTTDARNTGGFSDYLPTSAPNFEDYRDDNDVFTGLAAHQAVPVSVVYGHGEAEPAEGELVSSNYFAVLGVAPRLGRAFRPEEERPGDVAPVTVISDRLWKEHFGASPAVVGQTITINRQPFTIAGVAPPGFKGTDAFFAPALWMPMGVHAQVLTGFMAENFDSRRALLFDVTGRLKPGLSLQQATAHLKTLASRLEREYPVPNKGRSVALVPLAEATINPGVRGTALLGGTLLMFVVALVLLIACANVANLLLARAAARQKEFAIRLSLGASRGQLIRQLLTESLVLASVSGALGLLLAFWGRYLLWSSRPPALPADAIDLSFDARVLAFTAVVSLATGVVFGLVPALQSSRSDLVVNLKDRTSLPTGASRWFSARNLFVAAQVALSLVALVAGGLFLRSLAHAQRIDPGFDVARLFTLRFDLGSQGYDEPRGREFHRQVLERVRALPGVQAAALTDTVPLQGGSLARSVFPEGRDASDPKNGILVQLAAVSVDYFRTMGIQRMKGRDFTTADDAGAPRVVIVNEEAARRFWPGTDAIGKRFQFFGDMSFLEVVGVARNAKVNFIGEPPTPFIYTPLLQTYQPAAALVVRASGDPASLIASARAAVQRFDRQLPLVGAAPLTEVFAQSLWPARMGAAILSIFGLLALLLAAIGIYGVTSNAVAQRTREIGVRMALGAPRGTVVRLVFGQAMALAGAGMVVGVAASLMVAPAVSSLLYGVSATDGVTFGSVAGVLGMVAALACYLPAWRASRVNPVLALRYE